MKIERGKIKKCSSEVPADCKALINKLKSCNQDELYIELKKIKIWNCGKCELYHWIDVLDLFDTILEDACHKPRKNQWSLPCDLPGFEDKKLLLLQILHFTALLIEHSFSRHLYNSMEHLTTLLSSCDMQVVLGVLNLLYVFSKRSNFITRLSGVKRQALLSRLIFLAESWGGKENGFGLAQCCQDFPITSFPSSATTLHFEFYDERGKPETKKPHLPTCIHLENVDKKVVDNSSQSGSSSAAEIMENLVENYAIPEDKSMLLFTHVRLAHCFSNYQKRSHCVQARLQALSVLVYSNALQDNANSLLYNGLIEELVDVLELKDPSLIEIKAASLRTLTSIIHLERNPRLNAIIDATGASSYHGFLPVLVRSCIQALTDPTLNQFPLPFATALFSCLYHLASYEAGGEALVACGMMESLLRVVNWPSTEPEHITFVTRAVRVIDLITNLDMAAFQTRGGLTGFINRLEMEVDVCRKEQPFVIRTRGRNSSSSSYIESQNSGSTSQSGLHTISESSLSPMDVDSISQHAESPLVPSNSGCIIDNSAIKTNVQCLPQRAALLKSMLNFLKKAFQDPTFSDSIRHVMDGPLPSALKHIISNAEYYGPSLFLLATDVVTVYVFQEPSLLSSLQDSGLTDIVLHALLVKDVPAAREVLASLPNVFSALCLNSRGLQAFVACKPFERLFKVLLSSDYLQAMRRRRSSDPMGDTATNLGNAVDELMRHQPSLKSDATSAIIKLLEEVCSLGNDPKYICTRPTASSKIESITPNGNASSSSGQRSATNTRSGNDGGASSDDEDDEDEESSTTSSNLKNGTADASSGEDKNVIADCMNSDSSKTPVPLVDYVLNVMKFVDAILSNNSTDDHCREFVTQKGLVPLMNILSLPNLPIDFPVTPACQAIAAVCKSILNLAHEPQVLKQGLINLSTVLESLEPLHQPPSVSCSTVLLSELASVAPHTISETTANAHTTPLLHAMSAAHAFIMMFVHVCRTGQSDIRTISINHWGSLLGLKVLKGLSKLYTALVWESTILLALCNGQPLPCNCEQHGRAHQLESLIPGLIDASAEGASTSRTTGETGSNSVTTAMEALSTDSPSSAPMEVDELVETFSGDTKSVRAKLTQSQQAQIKQIKPLLSGSSRLGRALAELFGLLVKLCVGLPVRQRRGQQILQTPSIPAPAARAVASSLTKLLANGLSWEPPVSFPSPYLRMTFFICSIGFTSPMLFDEKKFPYHLMLQKFLSSGGQDAFFEIFRRVPEITSENDVEKQDVPNGTGEFLDAWLMLLEKMINHKTVLDSPHTLPIKSSQPDYTPFSPTLYLIHTHKQAFNAVMQLWDRKPLKIYGARMSESILTVLCHIIKGEAIIKEKLEKEKESATESTVATSSNNTRRRRYEEPDVNPEHLQQLMDMGFPLEQAMDALYHSTTIEQATDFLLSNPSPTLSASLRASNKEEEEAHKDDARETEKEKQIEEEPLEVDILDHFTATRLIPGCMKLLDTLPDTVYRVCDLLVAIVHRNGPEWRDKMIVSLLNEIKDKLSELVKKGSSKDIVNWPNFDPISSEAAVRVHLLTLLFEELRFRCVSLIETSELTEQLIKTLISAQKVLSENKDFSTPKWLAPVLLLIDLYEKVSVASARRVCMTLVTSHVWKWFDDRSVRWCVYNASNNKTIDDAYRAGEHNVHFTAGRRKYNIQFATMLQISEETGNRRPVMLSLKSKDGQNNKDKKDKENAAGETAAASAMETAASSAMETDDPTTEEPSSSVKKEEPEKVEAVIKVIPGITSNQISSLISVCVSLIEIPVDPDTLHAVMRLCLRLTRNHTHATQFAEQGGVMLLIGLTQASSFVGFTSLATLLIRHVLEDPISLKITMEKVIRTATVSTTNTVGANKEFHYLFRVFAPAVCRDSQVFTEIAKSVLRVALPPASKRGEEDLEARFSGPNAVQFLKSLPSKSTSYVSALSGPMEEVVTVLLDALVVKVNYDSEDNSQNNQGATSNNETTLPTVGVFDMQSRPTPENMPHISRNSSANDLLQQDDDDISQSMDTSNDQNDTMKKLEKKDSVVSDDIVKKSRPLIPKSSICRLLAELVRSYPGCAKLVTEYCYRANQTELVTEECSALSFILDNLLPQCQTAGDKDTPSLARMLIAALSACNHCPEAQASLVAEVKLSLARALVLPESSDKHSRVQSMTGIIGTMIESCPASHSNQNHTLLSSFKTQQLTMNNIVRLLVRKGLVADLAKIPHSLDLSSPSMASTVNTALKPLETLSRIINLPNGSAVNANTKGLKSKTAPSTASATPTTAPTVPAVDSASVASSLSQANLNPREDSEDRSQAVTTAVTTESENTNTQEDITTEDATENDGLDLSMPGENLNIEQNEDSGEELDEIMDQLLVRGEGGAGPEAVGDMLMTFAENTDVQGGSQEDVRDSQEILISMDGDIRMDDHHNSQMISQHDSVYETTGDDHRRESSDSDSDSEHSDDNHEDEDHDDDDGEDNDEDDDDDDDEEGSNFEAEDDFADWEDQIFRVQDRTDDLFIHLEDMFPAAVRDYSILLGGTPDGGTQFRTLQVPLREEVPNADTTQNIPPPAAPGTVATSHPLLVRHTDPHGAVTYRVYRGAGRQRGYRLTTPATTWQVYSGGRRHPNPPGMLPSSVGLGSTRLLVSNDEFRFMAPEEDLFDLQEHPGGLSSVGGLAAIPSATVRWAEESRVLDGDSVHDCVTCVKPEIIEVLEKYRDEEIAERIEKKLKQMEEEELKKQKNKSNAKKEEESQDAAAKTDEQKAAVNVIELDSNPAAEIEFIFGSELSRNEPSTTSAPAVSSTTPLSASQVEMNALTGLATSLVEEVLGSTTSLPVSSSASSETAAVPAVSEASSVVQQTPVNSQRIETPGAPVRGTSRIIANDTTTPGPAFSLISDFYRSSDGPPSADTTPNYYPLLRMATTISGSEETAQNPLASFEQAVENNDFSTGLTGVSSTNTPESANQNEATSMRTSTPVADAPPVTSTETPPAAPSEVRNEMTPIEEENPIQLVVGASNNEESSGNLLGDLEIPEGVDPSFLAALPDNIRQEVIAEQLRLQRLRQPAQSASEQTSTVSTPTIANVDSAGPSTDGNFTEVSPEFLAALPPNIQEEVLQQQRQEQQRLAAINSNPEAPVDPAGFIQNLPPALRQQVLADMDDSVVAVLPTELASEAQTLRREVEARQRQLQERFFNHNSTALSSILRSTVGRLSSRHIRAVPQPHLAWAISQSVGNSGRSSNAASASSKVRGRFLLDHEGLTCLLVLLFVDEPRLNTSRLHRVLRNLSYHMPTREWIIKSLLDIMGKTEASKLPWKTNSVIAWQESKAPGKTKNSSTKSQDSKTSNLAHKCDNQSSVRSSQPAWLSISLDAALGCRATVFQIHRPCSSTSHSKGKSSNHHSSTNSSQSISVHPQASPIICRHILDTLISLAKSFPSHFLPSNIKDMSSKSGVKYKSVNKAQNSDSKSVLSSSSSSTSLESFKTDFWEMLMKLDSTCNAAGPSTKGKGKSLMRLHSGAGSLSGTGSTSDEEKGETVSFETSPLGLLINMLSHPVIKRSSLLTDRLLRLLALVSLGLPDQQNSANAKNSSVSSDNNAATNNESSDKSEAAKKLSNCDNEDAVEEDMEVEEERKREKDSIEQHLKLAVEVLTSKSCSEEGLEDATALLLQLSRGGGNVTRETVLKLLLDGASKLGEVVCSHIHMLMLELRKMNQSRSKNDREISDDGAESENADAANKAGGSLGVLQDRFTQTPVVVTAPAKVKAGRELQIPAMAALTSKTSSQSFFLRVLKVIIQLQQAATLAAKKTKRRSSVMSLLSIEDILGIIAGQTPRSGNEAQPQQQQQQQSSAAQPQQPTGTSSTNADDQAQEDQNESSQAASSLVTPMEVDNSSQSVTQEKTEDDGPRLSQQLVLEDLWSTLSDCLMELSDTPDHHAVLVLQPAVEAFFLVHASGAEKESSQSSSKPDNQENQLSHLHQDLDPLSPLPSGGESSKDNATPTRQNSTITIPSHLPPDTQKFLRFAETHRTVLNQILRQSTTHLADGPFAVLVDHTRVLDFDVKRRYFRQELERMDEGIRREDLAVHIRREHVFEESFRELHRRSAEDWKNRFYIVFEGEEGQDAGGLLREWYMIVSREIFNPMYALFTTSPGDRVTYMINSSSHCNSNHLSYFKFVGRVIAKAVYDNKLLECYFTRSFYNHILGKSVKHTDMESEDYSFYQGLVFLLDHDVKELGYDLTFSTEVQEFGVTEVRDLKPDGRNLIVTEENKQEYVRLVCQMKMTGAIRKQLNSFLEGFYDIIPKRLISIFNEQELELLISGLPVIDIDDLKSNTEYHKYQPNSLQIQWFWRGLRSFDQADRAKFLQFVTGTSKVPLQGFSALEGMNGTQKFQIHRDDRSTDRLPSAHTCFNQLDLPAYETYDKLKEQLLTAVHECSEGFGFA